jgi:hypothetical protein
MPLTDAVIASLTGSGKAAGVKRSDGKALYIHVNESGKYWRMNYMFNGKRKTLAFGVYPAVSIDSARLMRDNARTLIDSGIDPSVAKKEERQAQLVEAASVDKHDDWLTEQLQDNPFAANYLTQAAQYWEPDVFMVALRRVVSSRGGLPPGFPLTAKSMFAVLRVNGLQVTFTAA